MKKLLLFGIALGLGASVSAQQFTNISVDNIVNPSGTVYIDGNGNGTPLNTIEINVTNNDGTVDFPANTSAITFGVKLDGAAISDPEGMGFARQLALPLPNGASDNITITQNWNVTGVNPGTYELCVSVNMVIVTGTGTPTVYTNQDPNAESCSNLSFDFASSTSDISNSEISQIQVLDNNMRVFVKNTNQNAKIQVMSITGQVLKTVTPNAVGQNFYSNINVSDLSSGVYLVTVVSENGISTAKKVFIQ